MATRDWSAVPPASPASPATAHSSDARLGGRPTLSASVTRTPTTPRQMPSHWAGRSRSQPDAAPIAATASGEEHAISEVVPAVRPSAIAE